MSEGERENMDKKFGRQSSVPPKANGAENKKENGNSHNQKFQKQKRKDHGVRSHDQQSFPRRSQPSKGRFVDKRPRSRGVHNGNNRDTMKEPEQAEPEYGSVQSWGHKKNNLSHLLNFHFEPRDGGRDRGGFSRGPYRGKSRPNWGRGSRFNKECFLQANFQFMVKDHGDYSAHSTNPDVLVDWDLIEQVRIHSSGQTACPICLYPPTAAKITRCGHIYCWSCILHYLSLGDKAWRRCPICYDAIMQKDLKSVKITETKTYQTGDDIKLKLMKRLKGSTQAMPVDQWTDMDGKFHHLTDAVDTQYSKLLVVSSEEAQDILAMERRELQTQLKSEGVDSLEGSYVNAALELLKEKEQEGSVSAEKGEDLAMEVQQMSLEDTSQGNDTPPSQTKCSIVYASAFSDEEEDECPGAVSDCLPPPDSSPADPTERNTSESSSGADSSADPDGVEPCPGTVAMVTGDGVEEVSVSAAAEELSLPQQPTGDGAVPKRNLSYFYFFQAADGQNIFLHSLNAQCLVKEYGSLENCPTTITARIVELSGVTMNEELRQRLRYLGHLPVQCEFQVAELALKPPVLSAETLRVFSDKIERRKKQRQRKHREEQRTSRRIQDEENKKMGIDPRAIIVKSETVSASTLPSESPTADSMESTPIGSPTVLATSPKSQTSSDEGSQSATMSFAQMLRAGKAKPQEAWPKTGGPVSDSQAVRGQGADSDDPDSEDRLPVPGYKASFEDAIQKALDKYQGAGPEGTGEAVQPPTPSKKKKKQLKMLFSTSMNRAK